VTTNEEKQPRSTCIKSDEVNEADGLLEAMNVFFDNSNDNDNNLDKK
jgi:hypothetical protein